MRNLDYYLTQEGPRHGKFSDRLTPATLSRRVEEVPRPDEIRAAQYFKVQVADKPGGVARVLGPLRDAGVNLLAVYAFPRNRRTQVDVVPEDSTAFKNVAKQAKWKAQGPRRCFLVDGDDRPGALADMTAHLGSAKINVTP